MNFNKIRSLTNTQTTRPRPLNEFMNCDRNSQLSKLRICSRKIYYNQHYNGIITKISIFRQNKYSRGFKQQSFSIEKLRVLEDNKSFFNGDIMNIYRTHNCGELRRSNVDEIVKLSGWVNKKRDHGNLLFIDLRDHYGITQCVVDSNCDVFRDVEKLRNECIVTIEGNVVERASETVNNDNQTGEIEVQIQKINILSYVENLPMSISSVSDLSEETRLKYRFLDLRREQIHKNIVLRSHVISSIREKMKKKGFLEINTPILTSSSPEGARDFLIPSRLHPGQFYALPQAPQQFKQLLMVAGFDKYFQIAPCFRDEDSRADRSPGEFYQLDFEMSFVTQDDVFNAIEPVIYEIFKEFSHKSVSPYPFKRITYYTAMLRYGCDKPDLRNPLLIQETRDIFDESRFSAFAEVVKNGGVVRAIGVVGAENQPRSFFDKLNDWAKDQGMPGLGYIVFNGEEVKGPIAKFLTEEQIYALRERVLASPHVTIEQIEKFKNRVGMEYSGAVFFVCDQKKRAEKVAGLLRQKLGTDLGLCSDSFEFCWIVDFPMYELNEVTEKIDFSHNPFSMPQGGMEALENTDPLEIKAYQYDIVCNGIELSSGAIRNHLPELMIKAFAIAGYDEKTVKEKFKGIFNAFQCGAPPHGGCAPGIDRMIMLLTGEPNIREIIAFPLNQQAQDLMMNAPSNVDSGQLKELHIKLDLPPKINLK
ncbi:MAG: aspartate--tRNA ligase [Holosporaceae bacterium]|jgi:aspartyl-tRNA synthetase|nr:aspartate--tRNA ligase [Holosporaceae bacterium]